MAILKCKMCGGSMEIQPGSTVGECQYCGTLQTLPRLNDDRRANLLNRANHYRRSNEFDKATGLYEQILTEDDSDAEVYWALVLCRYGIKYEKDPASGKQLPTINRMQYASILSDADFKAACAHADEEQKKLYMAEARKINEIQKKILAISSREAPFDVFISYKEKDEKGQRTLDSVLATDIYEYLTKENLKVFLSRITLEDKLGTEYEPYIFAALNSAKVMIVVGTRPEHFNAVWVKNEWSRYLALIQKGEEKVLIPAFRDMDPYDLPEEFSNLVAQDMAKIGFLQDLKRGIMKIVGADKPKTETARTAVPGGPTLNTQLKRGYMSLEDRDWGSANSFFDKALDMDPECAEAYLGKALADAKQPSLPAFASAQTQKGPDGPQIAHCDADMGFVHASAQANGIPVYYPAEGILKRYGNCPREYDAWAPEWEKMLQAEKAYWAGDRYMSRAVRYAKGKLADSLQEIRKKSEKHLEQALNQSRGEDQARRAQCEQVYVQALRQTEQAVSEESRAAAQRREGDYQNFLRQMQNANNPDELDALSKKEIPGLIGYRNFDQLHRQCGENAVAIRNQNAARIADQERRRREESIRQQQERENKERRRKRQKSLGTLTGFLYYIAAIALILFLYGAEETAARVGVGILSFVFLFFLLLRSYFAGTSGGIPPIASTIFLYGAFSLGVGLIASHIATGDSADYEYYRSMGISSPYSQLMYRLLGGGDEVFAFKYLGFSIVIALLLVWIFTAIGKSVRRSLSPFMPPPGIPR